ncbi:MAG TPA: hypothetical protein VHJ69_09580 [Gemmatimonadales bacterium]|jgi:hypothetical protein|nr:hypothetical protein [Gemmatimonadales bacterium]
MMAKLTNAGLVAAALVLGSAGTAMAQDTSYTRTPLPVDTSTISSDTTPADTSAPAPGLVPDSTIADSARDTLRTDLPPDSGAAVPSDVTVPKREDTGTTVPDSTSP